MKDKTCKRAKRNGEFKHAEYRRLYVAGKRKILDGCIVNFFITGSYIRQIISEIIYATRYARILSGSIKSSWVSNGWAAPRRKEIIFIWQRNMRIMKQIIFCSWIFTMIPLFKHKFRNFSLYTFSISLFPRVRYLNIFLVIFLVDSVYLSINSEQLLFRDMQIYKLNRTATIHIYGQSECILMLTWKQCFDEIHQNYAKCTL